MSVAEHIAYTQHVTHNSQIAPLFVCLHFGQYVFMRLPLSLLVCLSPSLAFLTHFSVLGCALFWIANLCVSHLFGVNELALALLSPLSPMLPALSHSPFISFRECVRRCVSCQFFVFLVFRTFSRPIFYQALAVCGYFAFVELYKVIL